MVSWISCRSRGSHLVINILYLRFVRDNNLKNYGREERQVGQFEFQGKSREIDPSVRAFDDANDRREGDGGPMSFPKIPEGSGKKMARDARCSPWPNDSSFYNLEFLSERPNYRRTKGLLLLHAAADSVET